MRAVCLRVSAGVSGLVLGIAGPVVAGLHGGLEPAAAERLVQIEPRAGTPDVLDGRVYSTALVGNVVVLGGTFTQVRESGSSELLDRRGLVAFDRSTGEVLRDFHPDPDGDVNVVIGSPGGEEVFVGGTFTHIAGHRRPKLARVSLADGGVDTTFRPGVVRGPVKDLRVVKGRLWVAGAFTEIHGVDRRALATLDPASGAYRRFADLVIKGTQNGGYTTVLKMDFLANGSRMVAVGNFASVDGLRRGQIFVADLTHRTAQLAPLRIRFYERECSRGNQSYMRSVDFSPNGRFFVVATTGGYRRGDVPCDSTARFETFSRGSNVPFTWLDKTGGDTNSALEVTNQVVYVGGHARWQNNPAGNNRPGRGAVSRPGIAALWSLNGLPFSWNPTRTRGVGVFDLDLSADGLWVASDTDVIADEVRGRIALLPPGGAVVPSFGTPRGLDDVFVGEPDTAVTSGTASTSGLVVRPYSQDTGFGSPQQVPAGTSVDWSTVTGAFMLDGELYTTSTDGSFTRRSFDGETYGPTVEVDGSDQLVPDTVWHDDAARLTSLAYKSGRIYYTLPGQERLRYRYFHPESDVVGVTARTVSRSARGVSYQRFRGAFFAGNRLYWTNPDGDLRAARWRSRARSGGIVVASTSHTVSGPRRDGRSWRGRTVFVRDLD